MGTLMDVLALVVAHQLDNCLQILTSSLRMMDAPNLERAELAITLTLRRKRKNQMSLGWQRLRKSSLL